MVPGLGARTVHVWQADLDEAPPATAGSLSHAERARAERLPRGPARERWARARGILKTLLGGYLDADPRALRFCAGERGKPYLAASPVSFNVSHSGSLAFFAFSTSGPVGVDVQLPRPALDAPLAGSPRVRPQRGGAPCAAGRGGRAARAPEGLGPRPQASCELLGAGISISPGGRRLCRRCAGTVGRRALARRARGGGRRRALCAPLELLDRRWRAAGS